MHAETMTFKNLVDEKKSMFLDSMQERVAEVMANEKAAFDTAKMREQEILSRIKTYQEQSQTLFEQAVELEKKLSALLIDDPSQAERCQLEIRDLQKNADDQRQLAEQAEAEHLPLIQTEVKKRQGALESASIGAILRTADEIAPELSGLFLDFLSAAYGWAAALKEVSAMIGVGFSPYTAHRLKLVDAFRRLSLDERRAFAQAIVETFSMDLRAAARLPIL